MDAKINQGVRINKHISDSGFCSRREADRLIDDQRVTINNKLATPGDRVQENDKVRIDGEPLVFIPQEARPKKHRWGPPRNNEEDANTPHSLRGKRGVGRHNNTPKPSPTASSKRTKKATQSKLAKGNNRSAKSAAKK